VTVHEQRCEWAATPLYWQYHDCEWGVPLHDDRRLFEFIVLEGAQAGLSWSTILRKRAAYRAAFHDFDLVKVARLGSRDVERLMDDEGIVRNRQKILSAVQNARAALDVVAEYGSLDSYIWSFVENRPIQNAWQSSGEVPARTAESDAMSKTLKKHGFSFVGSTICYAFMQAVGMVNDHTVDCFRFDELGGRDDRPAKKRGG
jgi:DNA-3-methyladenine glycosylase I